MERRNCLGLGGWLFGHRYDARYSVKEHPNTMALEARGISADTARRIAVLADRTYHGDVCVRCGSVVNREA